jgi:hypothetical protein
VKRRKREQESLTGSSTVGYVFEPKFEVVDKHETIMEDEQVNMFEPGMSGSIYLD